MNISIVVPAYNEEKVIEKNLNIISEYCEKKFAKFEIIVVDDGSIDRTKEILRKSKDKNLKILINKENKGKGYSVKKGILKAKYEYVLFTDSDLATPIFELEKFVKEIKNYDIVIASRNLKESNILKKQSFFRRSMGKSFALITRVITNTKFKDTQCGFKLFRTKPAKEIVRKQTIDGWAFDVELLTIARKKNYLVKEIGVKWINDEDSRVNPIKDSIKMLSEIIKIRIKEFKGKYN